MEIFEVIDNLREEKNISKRDFAKKLIELEVKSNRTGEVISENIVYSYLSGNTAIKAYLIPYIAEVLGVPEQFLFEETPQTRMRMIKHITNNLTDEERIYLQTALNRDGNVELQNEIVELIKYAPEPLLRKIEKNLKDIKEITNKS